MITQTGYLTREQKSEGFQLGLLIAVSDLIEHTKHHHRNNLMQHLSNAIKRLETKRVKTMHEQEKKLLYSVTSVYNNWFIRGIYLKKVEELNYSECSAERQTHYDIISDIQSEKKAQALQNSMMSIEDACFCISDKQVRNKFYKFLEEFKRMSLYGFNTETTYKIVVANMRRDGNNDITDFNIYTKGLKDLYHNSIEKGEELMQMHCVILNLIHDKREFNSDPDILKDFVDAEMEKLNNTE